MLGKKNIYIKLYELKNHYRRCLILIYNAEYYKHTINDLILQLLDEQ